MGDMSKYKSLLTCTRAKVYLTPEDFLRDVVAYFEWVDNTPHQEEKVHFGKNGGVTRADVAKTRVKTKQGLANHLGIPVNRLESYKSRKDPAWGVAVAQIEQWIYDDKYQAGSSGLANATMMMRDLGLSDKQEIKQDVVSGQTHRVEQETPLEHLAIHVHPNDPDPTGLITGVMPRPLFSQAQLNAGIGFPSV